jgi:hypothetical protein
MPYPTALKRRIAALFAQGRDSHEIADLVGKTERRVHEFLVREGFAKPRPRGRPFRSPPPADPPPPVRSHPLPSDGLIALMETEDKAGKRRQDEDFQRALLLYGFRNGLPNLSRAQIAARLARLGVPVGIAA